MKKSIITLSTLVLALAFFGGSAMAAGEGTASAKFAATWSTVPGVASVADTNGYVDSDFPLLVDKNMGYTLAKIKVPQDKELLIGVSAEIGIVTDTSIRGKEGGSAKAIAGAGARVKIFAVPEAGGNSIAAKPGPIMLSKRVQELSATLGGVLQACIDEGTWSVTSDGTCTETCYNDCAALEPIVEDCATGESCTDDQTTIPCECYFTDEEIGLLLDTTAAHHFNFVLPNMPQGVYEIKAVFITGAGVEIDICDDGEDCSYDPDGTVEASAYAKAIINKTMLTVQQVRAAEGGLNEMEIIEP